MRGPWNRFSRSAFVECVEEIAHPIKSLAILKEGLLVEATDYLANRRTYITQNLLRVFALAA